jgi:hypothetical protein
VRRFQKAWENFIALQGIDYTDTFSCKCPDEDRYQYVIADGIILGTNKREVSFVCPEMLSTAVVVLRNGWTTL